MQKETKYVRIQILKIISILKQININNPLIKHSKAAFEIIVLFIILIKSITACLQLIILSTRKFIVVDSVLNRILRLDVDNVILSLFIWIVIYFTMYNVISLLFLYLKSKLMNMNFANAEKRLNLALGTICISLSIFSTLSVEEFSLFATIISVYAIAISYKKN